MPDSGSERAGTDDSTLNLFVWGALALCAVVLATASVVMAVMSARDGRIASAPHRIAIPPPMPVSLPNPFEIELARLRETVRTLSVDRERLSGRLEQLERAMGDVTASIPREREPAPTVAPVEAVTRAVPALPEVVAIRTEFAVDLGAEASVERLRTLWNATRATHSAALEGLRPLIRVRDGQKPGAVELRLLAGPLANAAAAARICAALAASKAPCKTAVFEGQRLTPR
jgi:hypothetical protein